MGSLLEKSSVACLKLSNKVTHTQQTLLPPDQILLMIKYKRQINVQVCIISDISLKGFNYSFDALIIFANFLMKSEKKHIKGSVFILNLPNLHDFIGYFGSVAFMK